jgi:hypothetical protein
MRPGDRTTIRVTARDAAAAANEPGAAQATASATIAAPDGATEAILLAPVAPGRFEGRWRATSLEGVHRVSATVNDARGDARGEAIVAVDADASLPPDPPDRMSAWAGARKGRVFGETELGALSAALLEQLAPVREDVRWHPMRSPWWIVPFAGLLAAEWIARRKRGGV